MPSALITGSTGLLGYHIARELLDSSWSVRALVRDPAEAAWLTTHGVELAVGDVRDSASLRAAMSQIDVCFHCAATIASTRGWEEYRLTNVEGTRNVIAAAAAAGARVVHASSVAVYGPGSRHRSDGLPTSEDSPFAPLLEREYYARSKRESEEIVLDAHRRGELWACALRPDVMYGENDRQFVPRVARMLSSPVVPVVGAGTVRLPIVAAANVAQAALLAAVTHAAGGKVYNVANDFDVTYLDFVRLAAEGLGRSPRIVHTPAVLARSVAHVLEMLASTTILRGVPLPARNSVDFVTRDNPFTSDLARSELGWVPRHHPSIAIPAAFRSWGDGKDSKKGKEMKKGKGMKKGKEMKKGKGRKKGKDNEG